MTDPPAAAETIALAAGFPPLGREDWQRLVAAVLNKGRADDSRLDGPAAEAALRRHLEGGLEVDALYLRQDRPLGVPGRMPFTRGRAVRDATLPWDVRQLHDDPDPAVTRQAVLDDLEHGGTSVWVHVGDDGVAVADLAESLAEVRLELAPVVVSSVTDQHGAARALLDLVAERESVGGNLGLDPLGAAARLGTTPDLAPLADLVRECLHRDGWRAITVDARVLHEAGATDVDALAVAVAHRRRVPAPPRGGGRPRRPTRSAISSCASAPPPTSSSPRPPCVPCAGSGPGSARPAAWSRTSAACAPTRSPACGCSPARTRG